MRNLIVGLVITIALATATGEAVDLSKYKQYVGDSQWHTKLNNFIDAVVDQVSAPIAALQTSIDGLSKNVINLDTTITRRAMSENCLIFNKATPTYSDGDTFTMPGDYTSRFADGKIVHAYCGTDGMKYSTVASSTFGGGITTVELNTSVLTSNLTQV